MRNKRVTKVKSQENYLRKEKKLSTCYGHEIHVYQLIEKKYEYVAK